MSDRLSEIKRTDYLDLDLAKSDITWLVAEVERLRATVAEYDAAMNDRPSPGEMARATPDQHGFPSISGVSD